MISERKMKFPFKLSTDINEEREKQVIEETAEFLVRSDLDKVIKPLLEGMGPISSLTGQLFFISVLPLSPLFGESMMDLTYLLGKKPESIIKSIMDKLTLLKEKYPEEKQSKPKESIISRIISKIGFQKMGK